MAKKPTPFHRRISMALRRVFYLSDIRRQIIKASGQRCAHCKKAVKKLQVDHIIPVGPTPGSKNATPDITWDGFINRLFCDVSNLQALCKPCHKVKTYLKG